MLCSPSSYLKLRHPSLKVQEINGLRFMRSLATCASCLILSSHLHSCDCSSDLSSVAIKHVGRTYLDGKPSPKIVPLFRAQVLSQEDQQTIVKLCYPKGSFFFRGLEAGVHNETKIHLPSWLLNWSSIA